MNKARGDEPPTSPGLSRLRGCRRRLACRSLLRHSSPSKPEIAGERSREKSWVMASIMSWPRPLERRSAWSALLSLPL
eukprot:5883760-Pyramimonas_sp.AAC.1